MYEILLEKTTHNQDSAKHEKISQLCGASQVVPYMVIAQIKRQFSRSVKIITPNNYRRRRNMSQINITLNYQEALDLFSKDRNEAFAILIQKT